MGPEEGELRLPLDPRTLLVGLARRWSILLVLSVVAVLVGIAVALNFGKQVFYSEVVLLYSPSNWANLEAIDPPSLKTQHHLVKLSENMATVRRELGLEASLKRIGASVAVHLQKETDLMTIGVQWDDPGTAQSIAATLSDCFLGRLRGIRRKKLETKLAGLEGQLAAVMAGLHDADEKLRKFTTSNGLIHLEKETEWYLNEVTELELLFQQAQIEKRTNDLQVQHIGKIIQNLRTEVETEKKGAAKIEKLEHVRTRIERMNEAIIEDRKVRRDQALLDTLKKDLERKQRLFEKGLISKGELEQSRYKLEAQRIEAVDSPKIRDLKKQVKSLDEVVIPEDGEHTTPTANMLHEMIVKDFQVRLESVSLGEKVRHLDEARKRTRRKLESLNSLERRYVELSREVTVRQQERLGLEESIATTKRALQSDVSDFSVVAEAKPGRLPIKSNRKLLCIGITGALFGMGFALVLALELLVPTIRSAGDVRCRGRVNVLCEIPYEPYPEDLLPVAESHVVIEACHVGARRLLGQFGLDGGRILFLSPGRQEGRTTVLSNLAFAAAEQGEQVYVVDASSSRGTPLPEDIPGVETLALEHQSGRSRGGQVKELRKTLDGIESGVVLIDGPAVLPSARAESFVDDVDGAVLVVRAGSTRFRALSRTVERLSVAGIRVLGAVVVGVHPAFQEGGFDLEGHEEGLHEGSEVHEPVDEYGSGRDWEPRSRGAVSEPQEGEDHDKA